MKAAWDGSAIELEENPDILAGLRAVAPGALLVGLAAETHDLERNARAKLERKGADLLVANNVMAHVPDLDDFTAALQADEDPDRLSFSHAVRVIRRKIPHFAALSPSGQACSA